MEFIGKAISLLQNPITHKFQITFEADSTVNYEEINALEKLTVTAKKYRKKRSRDANAYAWVLMSKIAKVVKSSENEIYEQELLKYGCYHEDEDGYIVITVKKQVDMSKVEGHWKLYKCNDKFSSYLMIKGSSQYDTAEMSTFIEGVVYDAKELGIDTITPQELERMKSAWQTNGKAF